tara:strand:+ start:331 stop:558 length:228 start_codon:yes stop_codon:yes gene_type:complete
MEQGKQLYCIISFIAGLVVMYLIQGNFNTDVVAMFETAYETGKLDGYQLGHNDRSISDYPFQIKETMCMFLYDHK